MSEPPSRDDDGWVRCRRGEWGLARMVLGSIVSSCSGSARAGVRWSAGSTTAWSEWTGDRRPRGDSFAREIRWIPEGEPEGPDFFPEPDGSVSLRVCYECADFVVVDKPAGQPMHPLRPRERGTLAQGLLAAYPEMRGVGYGPREPGILHRLDVGTSGLVIAARNAAVFAELRAELEAERVPKRYLALVRGAPAQRLYDAPLVSNRRESVRVSVAGRSARTRVVSVTPVGTGWSMVEVEAFRAARHQVRVHLASAGHPLAGDTIYDGPALPDLAHHFLHACWLRVRAVEVTSPLPEDRARVVDLLRAGG